MGLKEINERRQKEPRGGVNVSRTGVPSERGGAHNEHYVYLSQRIKQKMLCSSTVNSRCICLQIFCPKFAQILKTKYFAKIAVKKTKKQNSSIGGNAATLMRLGCDQHLRPDPPTEDHCCRLSWFRHQNEQSRDCH